MQHRIAFSNLSRASQSVIVCLYLTNYLDIRSQGTTVTLLTKTAQRYEGVVGSTSGEGDTTGVTLKDVKEITNPGGPLKDSLFIASTNIDTWSSGPADAKPSNGDSESSITRP